MSFSKSKKISVIIPVYNDPKGLETTLDSLVKQSLSGEKYEILPVDNNSTDNTGDVIESFEERYPNLVRGVEEDEVQSSYAARNKGIDKSKGDYLVFIDADMWSDEDALEKISDTLCGKEDTIFGTKVKPVITENTVFSRYRMESGAFEESRERHIKNNEFISTCSMIAHKSVFKDVGPFEETIISGGDREFGDRVVGAGYKLEHLEEIFFYHPLRHSFESMRKRWFRLGRGRRQLEEKYSGRELYSKRSEYDPRNFLPTLPSRMSNVIGDWNSISLREKTSFYLIYWIDKFYNSLGYWFEKLN